MIEYDETAKPKTKQRGSGSALNCLVMFLLRSLWKTIKWLTPRLAVIIAIGLGVEWGGLFHAEAEWVRGITSWFVIWMAIDYYRWHLARYET